MESYNPDLEKKVKDVMKHARRTGLAALLVIAVPVIGFGSVYNIQEQEQAVLTTFGKAQPVTTPGLHFKIPFVQHVQKVNTTIQGFALGYNQEDNASVEEDSLMITHDYNFVNVDFFVEYKVADPVKAVYASQDPVMVLKNISQSCIRTVIGSYDVDSVLTTGKNEIQSKVKDMIIQSLEKHDIGIQVVNVTIQDSEPPTIEVMEAFKAVETAKQGKETAINNANKYRNEKLPQATAEIDKVMQEAESTRVQRVNEANAEVAKFNAMYEEYAKNPEVTKQRMFYEAMEDILPNLKVIIDGTDKTSTILPLDSFTGNSGASGTSKTVPSQSAAVQEKPTAPAPAPVPADTDQSADIEIQE
ncbi:FtsH protease activity modulator HflK [Clostridium sp. chh4-2]|uniref:FtsH protease activity modulator HflK n=1 Tax=Clostridium sp. chh4-2 TaxID=2067550 RepID=UPI000CCF105F|nr:FtsH protease activity modulator HflK [Clostridium sp. chh4-2]PNV62896.1 FtsH protease activity modulator HflK [Clostridium sp. chh4-2]